MSDVVLITGASRGIGAATARLLAKSGYTVVMNYEKNDVAARAVYKDVLKDSPNSLLIKADVRSSDAVDTMFDEVEAKLGRVDALINNAGITSTAFFQDIDEEAWLDIFNVNVHGAYRCSKRAVKKMLEVKRGKIISVSSIWGVTGGALETHYSATKGALIAMNRALAKELGYSGITVNTVAPGGCNTDMLADLTEEQIRDFVSEIPAQRLARPEEIAETIKFLLSDAADYITGEVININGGAFI